MLTTDTVGGVWQYSIQLAAGLARFDVAVTLVSLGRGLDAEQGADLARLPNLRGHHHITGKLEWMRDSLADIATARAELRDLITATKPDILHSNQFCFGDLPTPCPRLVVAHSDVISWEHWCYDPASPPDPDWLTFTYDYHRLVQCGLHGANAVAAPSRFVADCLAQRYALALARTQVIPNGLNITPLIADKEPVALLAGRLWDRAKNVGLVLEAARQAIDGGGVHILLAGESAPPADGRGLHLGGANVEYLGHLSAAQLYAQYARARVYIAASRYEPFGLAAVEAAAHGCAILANDIPTFHEVWGDDALYFRRNDPAALRAALSRLLADPELAAAYGQRARALGCYTADRMAAQYHALYRQMLPTAMWYNVADTLISYPTL